MTDVVSPLTVFDDLYKRDSSADVIIPDSSATSETSETLYAWTIESGASINSGEITTIYTKTPDPVLDTSTGNFTELFDKDGNSYGKNRSDLMSWTLTDTSGKMMGETYVNSMDNSAIQLKAIGPV